MDLPRHHLDGRRPGSACWADGGVAGGREFARAEGRAVPRSRRLPREPATAGEPHGRRVDRGWNGTFRGAGAGRRRGQQATRSPCALLTASIGGAQFAERGLGKLAGDAGREIMTLTADLLSAPPGAAHPPPPHPGCRTLSSPGVWPTPNRRCALPHGSLKSAMRGRRPVAARAESLDRRAEAIRATGQLACRTSATQPGDGSRFPWPRLDPGDRPVELRRVARSAYGRDAAGRYAGL